MLKYILISIFSCSILIITNAQELTSAKIQMSDSECGFYNPFQNLTKSYGYFRWWGACGNNFLEGENKLEFIPHGHYNSVATFEGIIKKGVADGIGIFKMNNDYLRMGVWRDGKFIFENQAWNISNKVFSAFEFPSPFRQEQITNVKHILWGVAAVPNKNNETIMDSYIVSTKVSFTMHNRDHALYLVSVKKRGAKKAEVGIEFAHTNTKAYIAHLENQKYWKDLIANAINETIKELKGQGKPKPLDYCYEITCYSCHGTGTYDNICTHGNGCPCSTCEGKGWICRKNN